MNGSVRRTGGDGARTDRPHVVGLGGTLRDRSTSLRSLEVALAAAEEAGASTELLSLNDLDLPLYRPGAPLESYGSSVGRMLESVRRADAMIWSTGAYHGTLAGATKNALDFLEFLRNDEPAYLSGTTVGLLAASAGGMASVNAVNAMTHTAHALRATVASLSVPIPRSFRIFDRRGRITDDRVAGRLGQLGRLIVRRAGETAKVAA